MADTSSTERAISRNTSVTIGLLLVAISGAMTATWWFASWTSGVNAFMENTVRMLARVEEKVDAIVTDQWRYSDMRRWAMRLQEANPTITVPTPYEH